MRRVIIFAAAAVATYALITIMVLAITLGQGGGISCVEGNCPPIQDFVADHDPWPVVAGIGASLAVGLTAALRVR
jgi:hypothetical protein